MILKGLVSDDDFIFLLYDNNTLVIFEIIYQKLILEISYIDVIVSYDLVVDGQIHDFDIISDKYFILYSGNNTIQVYDIINYVNLVYRRTLPFYEEYATFNMFGRFFIPLKVNDHIIKNVNDGKIAILMFSKFY